MIGFRVLPLFSLFPFSLSFLSSSTLSYFSDRPEVDIGILYGFAIG